MPVIACTSLDEIRLQIDRLDRALVALVAERGAYVAQAARFKKNRAEVEAPQSPSQPCPLQRAPVDASTGPSPIVAASDSASAIVLNDM